MEIETKATLALGFAAAQAVFAGLDWAGISPKRWFGRPASGGTMKVLREMPVPVSRAAITLSVTAAITAGVGVYLLFGKTHPISFLALEISLALLVVMVFAAFKRARSAESALAELDKRHNQLRAIKETLFAQVKNWEERVKGEQEAFQKMVIRKDAEQSENLSLLNQYKGERDKEKAERERLESELAKSRTALVPSSTQQVTPVFPSLSALYNQNPAPNLTLRDYFTRAYYSPITAEVEQNIKVAAHNDSPNDLENYYARLIGVGAVEFMHDETWWGIFKSQVLLLMELNRLNAIVPIFTAKKFYDAAIPTCADVYAKYTFEQWVGWLKAKQLVVTYPSEMMEISHKGKDFLRYLAHVGRHPDDKIC